MSKTKPRARVDTTLTAAGRRHVAQRLPPPMPGWGCGARARPKPAGAGAAAAATSINAARAARRRPGPGCIRSWRRSAAGRRGARPCVWPIARRTGRPSRGSSIWATRWIEVSFLKNDDGSWTRIDDQAPPSELELQLRRLTGGGAGGAAAGCGRREAYEFASDSRVPAERAYASEEPGPRGHTTRCCGSGYGASRFSRWVPDLVALAQVRSLHSSGTRGRGVTRCKPTSSPAGLTRGSMLLRKRLFPGRASQKCFSRSGWIAGSSPAMTGGRVRSHAPSAAQPARLVCQVSC